MIKIKANEKLFDQIKTLSQKIMCQASYVQNTIDLEQDDIKEFLRMSAAHEREIIEIRQLMLTHIRACNK